MSNGVGGGEDSRGSNRDLGRFSSRFLNRGGHLGSQPCETMHKCERAPVVGERTHLWIRMYASWAVHLGFSPSFLRALLKESVLDTTSTPTLQTEGEGANHLFRHCCLPRFPPIFWLTTPQKISLSTSLPCFAIISLTITVNWVSSSFDHAPSSCQHQRGVQIPSNCDPTCITLFSALNVVAISVTAICTRSSNTNANFLPLLP